MNIRIISLFVLIAVPFLQIASQSSSPDQLLPGNKEVKGWSKKKTKESYKGDDLYLAINGAAEVYLEYGFISMARTSYSKKKKVLDVEVYQMKDSEAAYGIMTSMNDGMPAEISGGRVALAGSYYGMLTKGRYYVIITDPSGKGGISAETDKFINLIAENIKEESTTPELLSLPRISGTKKEVLFSGDIVLNNHYYLGVQRPFSYEKGAYLETAEGQMIILKCSNDRPADKKIAAALHDFENTGKYKVDYENSTMINSKGDTLKISSDGNLIIISIKKRELKN